MKKYTSVLNLLTVLTLLLVHMAGCTKEQAQANDDVKLAFRVSTKTLIGENLSGVTIQSVRIIISNPSISNNIIENKLINSQGQEAADYIFSLRQGHYKICIIANETSTMTPFLTSAVRQPDIDAIKVVTPTTEDDLVLYQAVDIQLRPLSSTPEQVEVSVDGGNSWVSPPIVNVQLIRVASKISLAVKKNTINPGDKFDIKKVELVNLASNTNLAPGYAYTGSLHSQVPFTGSAIPFINNDEKQTIFSDYIVSEYGLPTPSSPDNATALAITADYTKSGGAMQEVVYTVPVLGQAATDYSLIRNCHYNITATITQSAEFTYPLTVEY